MSAWLYWAVAIPVGLMVGRWMHRTIEEIANDGPLDPPARLLYCDNCAEPAFEQDMYHYRAIPWDVDSALAGESASICHYCNTRLHRRHRVHRAIRMKECKRQA